MSQHCEAEVRELKKQIDQFWQFVENAYSIEPRAYFEKEAPTNGFGSPLAQAAHHMWKRNPQVQQVERERNGQKNRADLLEASVIELQRQVTELKKPGATRPRYRMEAGVEHHAMSGHCGDPVAVPVLDPNGDWVKVT